MTKSLIDILVTYEHLEDDVHSEMGVEGSVRRIFFPEERDAYGDPSEGEIQRAFNYTAGIVARIGVGAASVMARGKGHGCNRTEGYCCGVYAPDSLVHPWDDELMPVVWITVPRRDLQAWMERVKLWLEQIAEGQRVAGTDTDQA